MADVWSRAERAPWPAPTVGGRYVMPDLGATLRRIADGGPDAFYRGPVAEAVAAACWLSEDDLAAHESEWVEPLRLSYRGVEVCELPPNGQGAAALMALGIYEELEPGLHTQIEAMKLALADAYAAIGDGPLQEGLLSAEHLAARRALVRPDAALDPEPTRLPVGGTTYLCVVDGDRMAVSFIQSVYESFGSGIVPEGLGFALQNRGAGFVEDDGHPNQLAPSKRPFHTIIPGLLLEDGELLGPFGVMGGAMQAQAHFQVVRGLVDDGLDPQSALDAPRWRVGPDWDVTVEPGLAGDAEELSALGHRPSIAANQHAFGVGQMIVALAGALIAGSDGRGDGHSAGL
jgi:gamma-glutamyltranspeptidase/glutathione hydrolase